MTFKMSHIIIFFYPEDKISPRDSYIVAQLASESFYRSQSREMVTMLGEYLESVRKLKRSCVTISR